MEAIKGGVGGGCPGKASDVNGVGADVVEGADDVGGSPG